MSTQVPPAPLEIGLVLAGDLDMTDHRAVASGVRIAKDHLQRWFPQFQWSIKLHRRPDWGMSGIAEPTHWLRQVAEERDANHWDFGLAIVNLDLVGHYRPFAFAAVSRPLDAAVLSTLRIDPDQAGVELDPTDRVNRIADRLARLLLHSVGHLCGLGRVDDRGNLMYAIESARDLDQTYDLDAVQRATMGRHLEDAADMRLEEMKVHRHHARWRFYLNAMWLNRKDIARSIWGARPWEFPRRLSRFTTAAISTLAILMLTAEAWDLGLSQPPARLVVLTVVAVIVTSLYVVHRQQLLVRRYSAISEQVVTAQMTSLGIVSLGMITMWLLLAAVSGIAGATLFDLSLIAQWAGEKDWHNLTHGDRWWAHLQLAGRMSMFVASIGILVGALGTSFESQDHFRHIIYVDEEI